MDFKNGVRFLLSVLSFTVLLAAGPVHAGETQHAEEPSAQTRESDDPAVEAISNIPAVGVLFAPGQAYAVQEVAGAATPVAMQDPLAAPDKSKPEGDHHDRD